MTREKPSTTPRIAIVHDWFYGGGAELVVEQLHLLYPDAPIYTSYCSAEWRKRLDNKVVTGYLQHWPFSVLRKFLPVLRQRWFRNLDLSGFDVVISSSGNGEAKFVLLKKDSSYQQIANRSPKTQRPVHICYCHTPTHFYWRKYEEYLKNPSFRPRWLVRLGLRILVKPLRRRDYQAAQTVDYFIANSSHIKKDIKQYYDRESVVIHPPVNTKKFKKRQTADDQPSTTNNIQLIMWGRHVPYKRFDLAIKACNNLRLPLTVVGEGPETENLKNLAGPTITFTGRVSDEELVGLAHTADAFLFPGEEDFGIAPVEALAAGLPIIAYKSGGALDYVEEGKTGTFFTKQSVDTLARCLKSFSPEDYDKKIITEQARKFSEAIFRKKIKDAIEGFYKK